MFRGRLAPFFQSALIVLLTLAAYFPAYSAGFIWDDSDYVANNFSLRTTHGLGQIWADSQASPQYYPLVFTTFWLEWHAWGSRPAGYHLDNVLIHAASAVLLWRLLRRLNAPAAYLAALIFALHPVQVESVAWVTERKNVLSTFFFICAMLAYVGPTPRLSRTRYALAFVLYAASLLAKTVAASFPAVVLLLLWWKRKQVRWRDVLALIPFFVLGLCLSSVTSHLEKTKVGAIGRAWDFSLIDHFLIATRAVWFYAAKLICPANLVFIYPRWDVTSHRFFWMAAGAVLLCVFAALILMNRRLGRGPAAAMICYAGMLVPALGFFHVYPMRYSFVADHFQYLASLAMIPMLAAILHLGSMRLTRREWPAFAASVLLACLTFRRAGVYHDAIKLWSDTVQSNPNSWMTHVNFGQAYESAGQLDLALRQYLIAADMPQPLSEDQAESCWKLGAFYLTHQQADKAEPAFRRALAIDPGNLRAHYDLAWTLKRSARTGGPDFQSSRSLLLPLAQGDSALKAMALSDLGEICVRQGDLDAARGWYKRALAVDPALQSALAGLRSIGNASR